MTTPTDKPSKGKTKTRVRSAPAPSTPRTATQEPSSGETTPQVAVTLKGGARAMSVSMGLLDLKADIDRRAVEENDTGAKPLVLTLDLQKLTPEQVEALNQFLHDTDRAAKVTGLAASHPKSSD